MSTADEDNTPRKPRESEAPALAPGLYIVATPIGNLRDITLRALDTLKAADLVLCEDTRVTAKLFTHYGISRPLLAYHDHNAARVRPKALAALEGGGRVALVSDAGTPLISDPGYKLVAAAAEAGVGVFAVPGPSSVTAALSIAGLPTNRFLFLGFLPPKSAARRRALAEFAGVSASLVVLEAAPRLAECLDDLAATLGAREAAIAREVTKRFEEVRRGPLDALAAHYQRVGPPKGEIVIVIAPPAADANAVDDATLDRALLSALAQAPLKSAVAEVVEALSLPKNRVYARALELPRQQEQAQ